MVFQGFTGWGEKESPDAISINSVVLGGELNYRASLKTRKLFKNISRQFLEVAEVGEV